MFYHSAKSWSLKNCVLSQGKYLIPRSADPEVRIRCSITAWGYFKGSITANKPDLRLKRLV